MLALTALLILALVSCAPRVAPVGQIAPDPERPGEYTMNPELPQPDPAHYQGGVLSALGGFLPSPWREILSGGAALLGGAFVGRRGPRRMLAQVVGGIESAKRDMSEEAIAALHDHLGKAQDDKTKKVIWEMRP